jgi:hypothetical protein
MFFFVLFYIEEKLNDASEDFSLGGGCDTALPLGVASETMKITVYHTTAFTFLFHNILE